MITKRPPLFYVWKTRRTVNSIGVSSGLVCRIHRFVIFVLLVFLTYIKSKPPSLKYTWMPDSSQFDFMVGISFRDVPVYSGVIIHIHIVLTSATPLRYYNLNESLLTDVPLNVHVIYREWDESVAVGVRHVKFQLQDLNHSTEAFEKSGIYAPVHDFATLTLSRQLPTHAAALSVRHPILTSIGSKVVIKSTGVFTIVGHGYADRLHVQQNVQLEAVDYLVEDVLVDCDEWIPRSWGYFVCLLNVDNFVGISPGAALLHNGLFFAVGSLSVTRGSETILLFTDLRKYAKYSVLTDEHRGTRKKPMW